MSRGLRSCCRRHQHQAMAAANGTAAMHTVGTCNGTASGGNPGVQGVGSAAAALQLLQEFLQVGCVGGSWIHSAAAAQRAWMVNKHT